MAGLAHKYPAGAKIVNHDRAGIGSNLQRKLILVVPETNKSFVRINEYIEIAKKPAIEISFRPG